LKVIVQILSFFSTSNESSPMGSPFSFGSAGRMKFLCQDGLLAPHRRREMNEDPPGGSLAQEE